MQTWLECRPGRGTSPSSWVGLRNKASFVFPKSLQSILEEGVGNRHRRCIILKGFLKVEDFLGEVGSL
jgi:hypothetical protein